MALKHVYHSTTCMQLVPPSLLHGTVRCSHGTTINPPPLPFPPLPLPPCHLLLLVFVTRCFLCARGSSCTRSLALAFYCGGGAHATLGATPTFTSRAILLVLQIDTNTSDSHCIECGARASVCVLVCLCVCAGVPVPVCVCWCACACVCVRISVCMCTHTGDRWR